jgi:dTDP-4-amino-4,6-dideoxygalactose transaminase
MTTILVLYAPSYTEMSGGVIVLHHLCHTLNERFSNLVRAYMSPSFRRQRVTTNPNWNTPVFHGRLSKDMVVLYPEIVTDNPLSHDGTVVRWMLSFCNKDFPKDYVFYYSSKGNDHYRLGEERRLFHVYTPKIPREPSHGIGSCYYVGKGQKTRSVPGKEISFRSTTDAISVFRKHAVFYSFDPYTYLSNLAVLCGCRSIVVPPHGLSKQEWFRLRGPYGYKGVAYGEDDLDRAIREIEKGEPWAYLQQTKEEGMRTVERFARFCSSFSTVPFHRLPAIDIDPTTIREHWIQPSSRQWSDQCLSLLSSYFPGWNAVLTTSATHALETIAILIGVREDTEVIVPSFTFSSTANAFASRGATIVMADSMVDHPNMDIGDMRLKIGSKTRAVVMVHYGGHVERRPFDLPEGVIRIDDMSHCIGETPPEDSDFCVFSFHTTKNISTGGEGGLLLYRKHDVRIGQILDKGTNRETASIYEWTSIGSAYRMPELSCLFLYPQLRDLPAITAYRRKMIAYYRERLRDLILPEHTGCHAFFFSARDAFSLVRFLSENGIDARRHYTPLHTSPFYKSVCPVGVACPRAEFWAKTIVRLPLHTFLTESDVDRIVGLIYRYYEQPEQDSSMQRNQQVYTV